jgi:hypothetical protein
MKRLIVTSLMLGLLSSPGVLVTSANAQVGCDGDVPVEWTRPGGYCEQLGLPGSDGGSIYDKSGGSGIAPVPPAPTPDPCIESVGLELELDRLLSTMRKGDRILVAQSTCPD